MHNSSQDPGHNTPDQKRTSVKVTVTHPHHPLFGQQLEFIKLRKGEQRQVVVRVPRGNTAYLPVEYTDYSPPPQAQDVDASSSAGGEQLLDVEGLLRAVNLVSGIKKRRRVAKGRDSSGSSD